MELVESIKEFDGHLNRYRHESKVCHCVMTFSVYLPPKSQTQSVPSVYYLSGLTCTDDNVRTKAGAQRYASELGIALIMPDTSPRGENVADEPEHYDLGKGAGFYVNATQEPWAKHYQMYDYVTKELPALIEKELPVIAGAKSIMGHSMGGHGALICALKEADAYQSVSAFSPICHPSVCAWGKGCFNAYLGENQQLWEAYDATALIKNGAKKIEMLIDQGMHDEFLVEQLFPEHLEEVYAEDKALLNLRMHEGYDHSYHFISTFIGEHLAYHAKKLLG